MHPARGLKAWEAADQLADEVCAALARVQRRRFNRTCDQLESAAKSVGANIAEGSGRRSTADRRRFFDIALASTLETLHWLRRAGHEGLIDAKTYQKLAGLASVTYRLLAALIRKLSQ